MKTWIGCIYYTSAKPPSPNPPKPTFPSATFPFRIYKVMKWRHVPNEILERGERTADECRASVPVWRRAGSKLWLTCFGVVFWTYATGTPCSSGIRSLGVFSTDEVLRLTISRPLRAAQLRNLVVLREEKDVAVSSCSVTNFVVVLLLWLNFTSQTLHYTPRDWRWLFTVFPFLISESSGLTCPMCPWPM